MDKHYDPQAIATRWYAFWEKNGYFTPSLPTSPTHWNPYTIMLPPPNVTGTLHMGHGFQVTLMDALIRYHHMRGYQTLWQAGTDHAGIATQMVVERQLAQIGKTRHELGREGFLEAVWNWKHQSDHTIKSQLRRMGASLDWTRERFSLDEGMNTAVIHTFIQLYQEGLIYRGKKLVNWDPILRTAISDLEVIFQETAGSLWYFHYPLADGSGKITIATTRPETILGDVAVAVHPLDPRYQSLIGRHLALPLSTRTIPIIGDESIDPAFGTGCVKITPAHDFNDYAIGQRNQLPLLSIFTPDAHINENAPLKYLGLTREAAREAVLSDLRALNLLEKVEPHTLQIPHGDRSGAIIEPYLTDQWYLRATELAGPAIEVVKSGQIKLVPEHWEKTYFQWLEHIEDWCISRQLWWGHRIPAWYDADGKVYVGENEASIRRAYHLPDTLVLTQDEDVLDTWFSASLWPFATLGWPQKTLDFEAFYPTQVLITGFDILFFWVARMIMMGLKLTGKIPFETVYITGLIRDNDGQKMSKSKGNVLDPIDLIDGIDVNALIHKRTYGLMQPQLKEHICAVTSKDFPEGIPAFGVDALRFTYYALANTGRDIRFDLERLTGYRYFCHKLWHAARYVSMQKESYSPKSSVSKCEAEFVYSPADLWILDQLSTLIQNTHHYFSDYRFDLLAHALYDFTWHTYCDWYIEFSKITLHPDTSALQKAGTYSILINVLEILLRLLHPLIPFSTEEIWHQIQPLTGNKEKSILDRSYPTVEEINKLGPKNKEVYCEAIEAVEWLKKSILAIRQMRTEIKISPKEKVTIWVKVNQKDKEDVVRGRIEKYSVWLERLGKVEIQWAFSDIPSEKIRAHTLIQELVYCILLDKPEASDGEKQKLENVLAKLQKERLPIATKVQNLARILNPSDALKRLIEQEKIKLSRKEKEIAQVVELLKEAKGP